MTGTVLARFAALAGWAAPTARTEQTPAERTQAKVMRAYVPRVPEMRALEMRTLPRIRKPPTTPAVSHRAAAYGDITGNRGKRADLSGMSSQLRPVSNGFAPVLRMPR